MLTKTISSDRVQLRANVRLAAIGQWPVFCRLRSNLGSATGIFRLCVAGLWLSVAVYTILFSALVLSRHDRLGTTIFDLGIFDQALWLISHGKGAFLTTRGLYPLQDHFTPILYLFAPLFWIYDSPKALLVFQVIVLAIGAVPLFHIAHRRLGNAGAALLVSVAYLSYPALQRMNIFDFHPECVAPPLLLSAFWYLEKRSWKPYFVCLLLLLLCKETMGLTVILLGVYVCCSADRRAGLLTALLGITGLAVALTTLRILNHGEPSQYFSFYSAYGDSVPAIGAFLISHPLTLVTVVCSEANTTYVIALLGPLAFLPLAAPEVLFLLLPALLANMLSSRPSMHTILYQYNSVLIPILFFATIEGMRNAMGILAPQASERKTRVRMVLSLLLAAGMTYGLFIGPFWPRPGEAADPSDAADRAAAACRALSIIPSDASVSAQTAIGAHLAHRRRIYMFPNPFQEAAWGNSVQALEDQDGNRNLILPKNVLHQRIKAAPIDYIVLGPDKSSHFPLKDEVYAYLAAVVLDDDSYGVICAKANLIVLKRHSDHAQGLLTLHHAILLGEVSPVVTGRARD